MHPSIIAALIFLGVSVFVILASAWITGSSQPGVRPLSYLICITGGLFGYGYGILMFPLDPDEKMALDEVTKNGALLVSGYVFGKLDAILTPLFKGERDPIYVSRFLMFIASFIIALISTFMARSGYFS